MKIWCLTLIGYLQSVSKCKTCFMLRVKKCFFFFCFLIFVCWFSECVKTETTGLSGFLFFVDTSFICYK